jgi:hypothetical protein
MFGTPKGCKPEMYVVASEDSVYISDEVPCAASTFLRN